jgi:hypothetical protein
MKKVLILSPYLDQALAVARLLRKYGKEWLVYGGLLNGEKISNTKAAFYHKIIKVKNLENLKTYDCVLPTGARSTYWLATSIGDFYVGETLYSRNNILCFDKYSLIRRLEGLGVPIPKTFKSYEEINDEYPIFFKTRFEKERKIRGIIYSRKDLEKLPNKHELIFQEYIAGRTTYGVGFIAKNGIILTSFQHEELLSLPIEGGSAIYLERLNDKRLLEYTQRILRSLGYSGWGLAEFKYCKKRHDYVLMEVNAKLWASIEFALINNNEFLQKMFNVSYPETSINSALYIDRLFKIGLPYFIQNIHYLLKADKIIRYSSLDLLPVLLLRSTLHSLLERN